MTLHRSEERFEIFGARPACPQMSGHLRIPRGRIGVRSQQVGIDVQQIQCAFATEVLRIDAQESVEAFQSGHVLLGSAAVRYPLATRKPRNLRRASKRLLYTALRFVPMRAQSASSGTRLSTMSTKSRR